MKKTTKIILNEEDCVKFEAYLDLPIKETGCGEKSIIYTVNSLASEVCNVVKKIDRKEAFPKILKRELKTYRFIGGK